MSHDPQNDPDFYEVELGRRIDIEGVWLVIVRNQDGEEYAVYADEFDGIEPR